MSTANGFGDLKLLTAEEVARILNVSVTTVYRWAESGELPAVRIGRVVRFNPEALHKLVRHGLDPQAG